MAPPRSTGTPCPPQQVWQSWRRLVVPELCLVMRGCGMCFFLQDTIRCVVASLTDDGGGGAEAGGVGDLLFEELSRPADAEVTASAAVSMPTLSSPHACAPQSAQCTAPTPALPQCHQRG